MQFSFTDEQEQFRDVVRRFLGETSPTTEVRRLMETEAGFDPAIWKRICEDLGLPGLHVPEAYGGQGFGVTELGIVLEEMGRALLCAPYFSSTVLAATAVLQGGDEAHKEALLPTIASGACRAALAITEPNGAWSLDGIEATAEGANGGFRVNGVKSFVIDGHTADLLVVAARAPGSAGADGLTLLAVAPDADGVTREPLATLDPTRKQARITFRNVDAEPIGAPGSAGPALTQTLDLATVALANEMIGGAQALLESAVDYAQMRVQFGRAIGSFQAIKHKCADMLLEVELAKSAAYYAAAAADENDPQLPALASLAKANASDTYMQTAASTIQIHGGIGFTWDNDTHLWFKRAKSSEVLLGDASYHRELLMQRWEA